jgi:hypothetical protein
MAMLNNQMVYFLIRSNIDQFICLFDEERTRSIDDNMNMVTINTFWWVTKS